MDDPPVFHVCIRPGDTEPLFNGVALCGRSVNDDDLKVDERFKWDEDVWIWVNDRHCDACMLMLITQEVPQ
jgi:hypothetical protein